MNKKIIFIVLSFLLIITTLFLIRGEISIRPPEKATIKIGKKEYKDKTSFKKMLWPKKYEIIVQTDNYEEYKETVKVSFLKKQVLEIKPEARLKEISAESSFMHNFNEYVFFFNEKDYILSKINLNTGLKEDISENLNFYPKKIIWSLKGNSALIFSEENRPKAYIYNEKNKKPKELNGEYSLSGSWSEDGLRLIIPLFDLSGTYSLMVYQDDKLTQLKPFIIDPETLNWNDKKNIIAYSATELGNIDCIFQIINDNSDNIVFQNNYCSVGSAFLKNGNELISEEDDSGENNIINIYNLENKQLKRIYDKNLKQWTLHNDLIYIITTENNLIILNKNGNIKKEWSLKSLKLDNIDKIFIKDEFLYLESEKTIYSIIIET